LGAPVISLVQQFDGLSSRWFEAITFADGVTYNRGQSLARYISEAMVRGGNVYGTPMDDVYPYQAGGPSVTLDELSSGGNDLVDLVDTASTEVTFGQSASSSLNITLPGGQVIRMIEQLGGLSSRWFESVRFSDGVTLNRAQMIERVFEDLIAAGGTVQGSSGNDRYVVRNTATPDVALQENNTGGTDTVALESTASSAVTFSRNGTGNNLIFTMPAGRQVTLVDFFQT
jgi:hypothetical protein